MVVAASPPNQFCVRPPLLPSVIKRSWPLLTVAGIGLIYVAKNYDIQGLDGIRLEPRTSSQAEQIAPANWPSTLPPSPRLPNTGLPNAGLPSPGLNGSALNLPSTSGVNSALTASAPMTQGNLVGTGLAASGSPGAPVVVGSTAVPSTAASTGAPSNWQQLLSVGEKLGMLEKSQTPPASSGLSSSGISAPAGRNSSAARTTLRIASFDLRGLDDGRNDNPAVLELTSRLLNQFDLIALQGIRTRRDDILPELVQLLNKSGRKFDFMIGPRVGRSEDREQYAFVYDTQRVETDRFQLYSVEDPEDMLHREPLVGWFRAVGAPPQEAFTFSLVNIHVDPDLVQSELQALPNLVQAIANDGRGEDDILLVGNFNADARRLTNLTQSGMRILLDGIATNPQGSLLLDNIVFPATNTTEYTGRSGSYDFLRHYNLTLEQAVLVSEHLPIWAEFSIIEGGRPGQVAGNQAAERLGNSGYN